MHAWRPLCLKAAVRHCPAAAAGRGSMKHYEQDLCTIRRPRGHAASTWTHLGHNLLRFWFVIVMHIFAFKCRRYIASIAAGFVVTCLLPLVFVKLAAIHGQRYNGSHFAEYGTTRVWICSSTCFLVSCWCRLSHAARTAAPSPTRSIRNPTRCSPHIYTRVCVVSHDGAFSNIFNVSV